MKNPLNRFQPLKTPGQEAAAEMNLDKDRTERIASYIDRITGAINEPSEEKYGDVLEKFQGEQFDKLSPEMRLDMHVALSAVAEKWQRAYENQENPNPSLVRLHTRAQELKSWFDEKLGGAQ